MSSVIDQTIKKMEKRIETPENVLTAQFCTHTKYLQPLRLSSKDLKVQNCHG
jgi:hypothetical protein